MRSFTHPVVRRSILALAIAQLVMCSLVPIHEANASGNKDTARIERSQSIPGVPVHNPDTCPICQLHSALLFRPEATHVAPPAGAVQRPQDVSTTLPVARAPPAAHQTRAPPLFLA